MAAPMNTKLLVDSIVRQTTVLIAQLCTAAGVRAPLAQIADQVFLGLSRELEAQGVGRKVAADMFGLALRSYQKKVQRLTESETQREKTLWEAVLDYLREQGSVPRRRIFERFGRDDEAAVAAILNDLVSSGLAYSTGRGGSAVFGVTSAVDQERMAGEDLRTTLPAMVWLIVYREGPLDAATLAERLGLTAPDLALILAELEHEGRVQREPGSDRYRSGTVTIAVGDRAGWEAAVLDHFQGVAKAIAAKVRLGPQSELKDLIGGATLSFDVHPGHPLEAEVYDLLRTVRALVNELWSRLAAHNRAYPIAESEKIKVTFYLGQNVERPEAESSPTPIAAAEIETSAESADEDGDEDEDEGEHEP
jgi:DprA winged helix domain